MGFFDRVFNQCSADKEYVRVYPLGAKELDLGAGGSVEPAEGVVEILPETGNEFYFVITSPDGGGEIIAESPANMECEFHADLAEIAITAIEPDFNYVQSQLAERGLIAAGADPELANSPSDISVVVMMESLPEVQAALDAAKLNTAQNESLMTVPDEEMQAVIDRGQEEITNLEGLISEIERLGTVIPDAQDLVGLIHENGAEIEAGMSAEQAAVLQDQVFGSGVDAIGFEPPAFAMGSGPG